MTYNNPNELSNEELLTTKGKLKLALSMWSPTIACH